MQNKASGPLRSAKSCFNARDGQLLPLTLQMINNIRGFRDIYYRYPKEKSSRWLLLKLLYY
jgi:hypothetical protein